MPNSEINDAELTRQRKQVAEEKVKTELADQCLPPVGDRGPRASERVRDRNGLFLDRFS